MTDMQMPKGGETNPLCPFNGEGGSLGEIMIRVRFGYSPRPEGALLKGHCMFAEQDQDTLKSLVELNAEGYFSGRKNVNLDKFIQALMRNCPEKFHDPKSLKLRRFFNEPRPHKDIVIPMAGCVHPYDEVKEPA